jgi:hypothetical protein
MARNYTIAGTHDGFGSQYLKAMGGFALCAIDRRYNYVHTPIRHLDHLSQDWVPILNNFIGIPDNSHGNRIHVRQRIYKNAHRFPDKFFNQDTMDMLREYYWTTEKPENCKTEICIHIRRGDLHHRHKRKRDVHGRAHKRMAPNLYYKSAIPKILKDFPNESITIHTDGKPEEFEGVIADQEERVFWNYSGDTRRAFHDMVSCKRLFLARSSLSFAAGLLNFNQEIYFQNGNANTQTNTPLSFWKNWNTYE